MRTAAIALSAIFATFGLPVLAQEGLVERLACLEAQVAAQAAVLADPVIIERRFLDGNFAPEGSNTWAPLPSLEITIGPEHAGLWIEARYQVALRVNVTRTEDKSIGHFVTRLDIDDKDTRAARALQGGFYQGLSGEWRWRMREDGQASTVKVRYRTPDPATQNMNNNWRLAFLEVVIHRHPEWPEAACGARPGGG